nr:hypothetical protein [Tanacetum cinerariifolium]
MADQRTMVELQRAPTEGYAEAIVVPPILAEQFELKHSLIYIMTSEQFFGLEKDNPHDHIRWGSSLVARKNPRVLFTLRKILSPNSSMNYFPLKNNKSPRTQDVLTIIENKSNVRNTRSKSVISQVKACDVNSTSSSEIAKLTHAVNQQMSAVTTAMTAILKQFQATPPPASVKAVEETYVTCDGAHPYYQCLAAGVANQSRPPGFAQPYMQNNQKRFGPPQGFNRGNNFNPEHSYQGLTQQNQNVHLNELEKVRRMNEANMKAMQTQIDMVTNELRNKIKNSIQTSLANQTNEIKNMMASLLQMNTASTSRSGSLPSNTVANPKGKLKAITTRSGLVNDGPTVLTPPKSINLEVDERVEETFMDPDLAEYTIKVPPAPVPKYKPPSQRVFVVHQRDPLHPNIPYPSRMLKQKQQEKDEGQIYKFWQMFKQVHINITLADALILLPNELKCKALADLGASINLMPLFVWKKLGLPELISTRMTLKLANRAICTPAGIARNVFVPVGKFTFPAAFVIVDYESDPRVPLILGRPFLRTARALIDVHESINLINVFNNLSKDFLKNLFSNQPSGNPTFSSHPKLTSPKVNIFDLEGGNVLSEKFLDLDSTKDLHTPHHDDTLSGSTTLSSNPLLEEFADEHAFLLKYDDDLQFHIESDLKEIEFLLYQNIDSSLKDSIDHHADHVVNSVPEMFTNEHALDYPSPSIFDEYDDDFFEIKSDVENIYDDPFDSKGEKIKESKLLIDELDLPCDFIPFEYDSFISQDFSRVDDLPSTNNEDNIFNLGILIQEKSFKIITRVVQDKKLATSNASSMLEDFDPPFYEPLFFEEVPSSKMLLPFSSENEEKVFKPGAHTSKKVHSSFILELSHPGYKIFKINQIFKSPMKILLFFYGKDTHTLAVPSLHFYPP